MPVQPPSAQLGEACGAMWARKPWSRVETPRTQPSLTPPATGDSCERLGIAYTAFNIAVATIFQFTLAINLIRRAADASAAAAAADAEQPDTPTEGVEEGHAMLHPGLTKHPTLSDLLAGRRGSRPGSASSTPTEGEPPSPPEPVQQQHRQQRLGASPLSAGRLQPVPPYSQQRAEYAYQQEQQPGRMHVLEMQPQPGWSQPHHRHAAEDDTAALLGGEAAGAHSDASEAEHQRGSTVGRWVRAAWRQLAAVEWGQVLHMPIIAAVAGAGGPCEWSGCRCLPACVWVTRASGMQPALARCHVWLCPPASPLLSHSTRPSCLPLPAACVVGCIPPVKGLLYGPRPPLRVVSEALDTLSGGLIPVSLPLLGAVLSRKAGNAGVVLRFAPVVWEAVKHSAL